MTMREERMQASSYRDARRDLQRMLTLSVGGKRAMLERGRREMEEGFDLLLSPPPTIPYSRLGPVARRVLLWYLRWTDKTAA